VGEGFGADAFSSLLTVFQIEEPTLGEFLRQSQGRFSRGGAAVLTFQVSRTPPNPACALLVKINLSIEDF